MYSLMQLFSDDMNSHFVSFNALKLSSNMTSLEIVFEDKEIIINNNCVEQGIFVL